jgi:flavodoxin
VGYKEIKFMKNLIVYYSFTGNNKKLAEYLRIKLGCDIARIETVKKRTGFSILFDLLFKRKPSIKKIDHYLWNYEHIIFIAPVWAGKIATPLKSFLTRENENIKTYSFITLCGGGSPNQKEKIQNELRSIVQKKPLNVVELWVNDLLSDEKKNTMKYTSGFRIESDGFGKFENQINDFVKEEEQIAIV